MNSSLKLFGIFVGACPNNVQRPTEEQLRAGIATEDMDFPLFRYNLSLGARIGMVNYSHQVLIDTNEKAIKEIIEDSKKPVGTSLSSNNQLAMINYFESFIDQIHKTMETIGTINLFIFPMQWDKLTGKNWGKISSFNYQRMMILKGKLSFGREYDQLIGNMEWFEELRNIRDNSNHSMSGLPVRKADENGRPVLEYYVHICLGRTKQKGGVVEYPIVEKTEKYFEEFQSFLDKIGQCYLQYIDPEKKVPIPILKDGIVSFQNQSFNEFKKCGYIY